MDFNGGTILLVEDNEDDAFIFRRAYQQAKLPHALQIVGDGQQAIDYLNGNGIFADRSRYPSPFLVLLDLKLPTKSGLNVLQAIRSRPALDEMCVIVLTSSAEERDIRRARDLGAQAFLVKPPTPRTIATAVAAGQRQTGTRGSAQRLNVEGDLLSASFPSDPQ